MHVPTMTPAQSTTSQSGRVPCASGTCRCMSRDPSEASRRNAAHPIGSAAAFPCRVAIPKLSNSHGLDDAFSWRSVELAPLDLDDRATRLGQATADQLDFPRRPSDAVEVVSGERRFVARARQRRGRSADDGHKSATAAAPCEHVDVVVAVDDQLGTVTNEQCLELGGILESAQARCLSGQWGMVNQDEAEQSLPAQGLKQARKPLALRL